MKNSNDTIGNRTRDLLACSAVPQPTTAPWEYYHRGNYFLHLQVCYVSVLIRLLYFSSESN